MTYTPEYANDAIREIGEEARGHHDTHTGRRAREWVDACERTVDLLTEGHLAPIMAFVCTVCPWAAFNRTMRPPDLRGKLCDWKHGKCAVARGEKAQATCWAEYLRYEDDRKFDFYFDGVHLATDGPLYLLHDEARRIGLNRNWFQNHPRHPHYDIWGKYAAKLDVNCTTRELVRACSRKETRS